MKWRVVTCRQQQQQEVAAGAAAAAVAEVAAGQTRSNDAALKVKVKVKCTAAWGARGWMLLHQLQRSRCWINWTRRGGAGNVPSLALLRRGGRSPW
jgi:hypothetical protein